MPHPAAAQRYHAARATISKRDSWAGHDRFQEQFTSLVTGCFDRPGAASATTTKTLHMIGLLCDDGVQADTADLYELVKRAGDAARAANRSIAVQVHVIVDSQDKRREPGTPVVGHATVQCMRRRTCRGSLPRPS